MKRQSFEVRLNSVISFVFIAFANHEYCVTVLVTSLASSLYRQAHKLHSNSYIYFTIVYLFVGGEVTSLGGELVGGEVAYWWRVGWWRNFLVAR